jgi:hypothetical protein
MTDQTDGQTPGAEALPVVEAPEAQVETNADATTAQTDDTADTGDDDGSDSTANAETQAHKPAKGVQKRLDELTRQRHEKAREADYWREMAMRLSPAQQDAPPPTPVNAPTLEQFDYDPDAFQAASAQFWTEQAKTAARSALAEERAAEQAQHQQATVQQRLTEAMVKHADFDEVSERIPLSDAVQAALATDADAIDVLMAIGRNEAAAAQFARMTPFQQAVEIGRVKASIAKPATTINRTPPPPPPQTVAGIAAGVSKDPGKMTMDEYASWRKANP